MPQSDDVLLSWLKTLPQEELAVEPTSATAYERVLASLPAGVGSDTRDQWTMLAQLAAESDRGAALVAAAFLEERLSKLLELIWIDSPGFQDIVRGPTAPLGSFDAKIKVCHGIGLISSPAAHQLHILRKIRNHFAHEKGASRFDESPVRDLCDRLVTTLELLIARSDGLWARYVRQRDRFMNAASELHSYLEVRGNRIGPIQHAPTASFDFARMNDAERNEYIAEIAACQKGQKPWRRSWYITDRNR
jgi:hypothetical protein